MRIEIKSMVAALAVLLGLSGCSSQAEAVIDYQAEMVELLSGIRTYADSKRPGFQLIANGGSPLYLADNGNSAENAGRMLQIMDGQMAESVFYRWDTEQNCAVETDPDETAYFEYTLAVPRSAGLTVLSLDYVDSPEMEADSYKMNAGQGYLGWASYRRSLDEVPGAAPHGMNTGDIKSLKEARNYLVLLNPGRFKSRQDYLDKLAATYYDVLIVDLYYGTEPLTPEEVKALQHKPNGAQRQVFAYMSDEIYQVKLRLYQVEELAHAAGIVRASKSHLVNVKKIQSVRPALNSRLYAKMPNGEEVLVTRKYAPALKAAME